MSDAAVAELVPVIGVRAACQALGLPQAGYYRRHRQSPAPVRPAPTPQRERVQPRALTQAEREAILAELHGERFVDLSPAETWAILLDEGRYLGSISTFYRLLRAAGESRERRRQATHPAKIKPELLATAANMVWSWDITKLHGPAKWTYYYLYVILDIYSRYVVGWMVAGRESAALAEVMIRQTCAKQGIERKQLTIHADRGSSMTSKPVAFLLADLGVTQSHSRPHVSDDNPYSEAQFKTLKYRPDFPGRFSCIEAARVHCQRFFGWSRYAGDPLLGHRGFGARVTAANRGSPWTACRAWFDRFNLAAVSCSGWVIHCWMPTSNWSSPGRGGTPHWPRPST